MTPTIAAPETAERLAGVRSRIATACERAGRDPASVRLIAVSKGFPAGAIVDAWNAGLRDFGENRVQEAAEKLPLAAGRIAVATGGRPTWHLIGHLQTNKARRAAALFDVIHSVDSERLVGALDQGLRPAPLPILLEVNVAGDPAKAGVSPAELPALLAAGRAARQLVVTGLMTVAPFTRDPKEARPVFRKLRELAVHHGLSELSMGMSEDFEVAIEEGATWIRVGRAIFGERRQ